MKKNHTGKSRPGEFVGQIRRVFGSGKGPVSDKEIVTLTVDVVNAAGFELDRERLPNPEMIPDTAQTFTFDKQSPSDENLQALQQVIRDDLMKRRDNVQELHYRLVGTIFAARFDRDRESANPSRIRQQYEAATSEAPSDPLKIQIELQARALYQQNLLVEKLAPNFK
jgi:hypothetical protein